MIVRIDVTQADIDAGEREDCLICPIALALSFDIDIPAVRR